MTSTQANRITIDLNGPIIFLERQPWDTQMLERECARITDIQGDNKLAGLSDRLKSERFQYVIARLESHKTKQIQNLIQEGFVQLEGIESFCQDDLPDPREKSDFLQIRQANSKDADVVAELCGRTFKQSRFHKDKLVTPAQARRVHEEWARNSVLGKAADVVWLAEVDAKIVGMISVSIKEAAAWIGLVCVDEKHSGQGLAGRLVQKACHWAALKGASKMFVQTQSDNNGAISLYSKQGFKPHQSFVTLRWSVKG